MENAKKNRGPVIALIALVAVVAVCVVGWLALRPETAQGAKTIEVDVTYSDGSTKSFELHTDAEYLGEALMEGKDIAVVGEEGPYGLYIQSVGGDEASDADHTFWAISQDGEDLLVGADSQPILDGEHYELELTKW